MITVRDIRKLFAVAKDVIVIWNGEEYSVHDDSPSSEAFGEYVVDGIRAIEPDVYRIFLKQEYVKIANN